MPKGIIERAYEIARAGDCRTVTQIAAVLRAEHYDSIASHLQGGGLRRDLKRLIAKARASLAA